MFAKALFLLLFHVLHCCDANARGRATRERESEMCSESRGGRALVVFLDWFGAFQGWIAICMWHWHATVLASVVASVVL